jgi:hypothetical protein
MTTETRNLGSGYLMIALLILSATAVAGSPAGATVYSCEYEVGRRGTSGEASVELRDGVIQKVSFDNFFEGLSGTPGFTCQFETGRGDKEAMWKDAGKAVEIRFPESPNFQGDDLLTISPATGGFTMDLSKVRSLGKCGAGAELPEKLTIYKSSKKCRVKL